MIPGDEDIARCWPGTGEIEQIELPDSGVITVGRHDCTRIEKTAKAGDHCFIPYVRVWKGGTAVAEFSQHKLNSVIFFTKP